MLGILLLLAVPAGADETRSFDITGWGPRFGVSIGPNQVVGGAHVDMGDVLPHTTLLLPVVEFSSGDLEWRISVAGDLFYRFQSEWGSWGPYVGGELAFATGQRDRIVDGELVRRDEDFSDIGLAGIFGIQRPVGVGRRFGVEIKVGVFDAPDFKVQAIWTFGD